MVGRRRNRMNYKIPLVGLLMSADVLLADDRFVSPDSTHARALRPEREPRKVALLAKILPVHPHR